MDIDTVRTIVVGIDASPASEHALVAAAKLTRARPGATAHLVHVASGHLEEAFEEDLESWRAKLPLSVFGGAKYELHSLRAPSPATAIVAFAAELNADLIVVGTAGRRGLSRMVLGSVAEEVARTAGCAVLIAREKGHES